jgi:hypothetical protein
MAMFLQVKNEEADGFERARDPLLEILLPSSSNRDSDDARINGEGLRSGSAASRGGLNCGESSSASGGRLHSREAQPDELQAASSARAAAEKQLQECQLEFTTEHASLQEQLRREQGAARHALEECMALREQLRQVQQQATAAPTDQPPQRGELGADAAAATTVPGRGFFDEKAEAEGASGPKGISYHAAATPERNQSRLAHRAGQPPGAK